MQNSYPRITLKNLPVLIIWLRKKHARDYQKNKTINKNFGLKKEEIQLKCPFEQYMAL